MNGYGWRFAVICYVTSAKDLINGIAIVGLEISAINIYCNVATDITTLVTAAIYTSIYGATGYCYRYISFTWSLVGAAEDITGYGSTCNIYINVFLGISVIASTINTTGSICFIGKNYSGIMNGIFVIACRIITISCTEDTFCVGLIGITTEIEIGVTFCISFFVISSVTTSRHPTIESATCDDNLSSAIGW